jgi:cellulose synthase/poly-beta-1,6-N-acetylglucosamine synthase-like glycosyltransferase
MAETKPQNFANQNFANQNFANHVRLDPLYHFFLIPIFGLGVLLALIHFFAHVTASDFRDNFHSVLIILLAVALLIAMFKIRLYALKVQDRVIRLEERLRLTQLLPDPLRSRIPELTEGQLIALRFASDAEVPKLAERVLNEKLSGKQIKQAIQNWRPDYWRV